MNVEHPILPIFHGLPKTHKKVFPPPLRPIVSGIGSLCEHLSEWVDVHLPPLVISRPGYLRDSKQVLQVLQDARWEENYSWITLDVVSLYSNIPHNIALTAVEYMIKKYSNFSNDLNHFLIMAIDFLLSHNYFRFDASFFIQQVGAPMGSKFSPSLANLYMSYWEEKFIFSYDNPFTCDVVWYGRYIDDLIIIWGRDVASIPHFHRYVNENNLNLKFTCEFSTSHVNFLDLTLRGMADEHKIHTSTFRKPDAGNTILNADSNHPQHTLNAIPVGEYLRLKRACSNQTTFNTETESLDNRLHQRGYRNWQVNRAKTNIKHRTRESLLQDKGDKTGAADIPTFSTSYSVDFNHIRNILLKYLPILNRDDKLKELLNNGCRCVAKRGTSLGNILSPSDITTDTQPRTRLLQPRFFHVVVKPALYVNML